MIVFPDPVPVAIAYLREQLVDVPVEGVTPSPLPVPLVFVRRVGGQRGASPVLDVARLDAIVWHDSNVSCVELAQRVRALLHDARGRVLSGVAIGATNDFAGPALIPDPDSGRPRCLLTVEWTVRA